MSKKLKRKRDIPDDLEKSKRRKPVKSLDLKSSDDGRVSNLDSTRELTKVNGISRKNKIIVASVQPSSSSNEEAFDFKEHESLNATEIDKSKATESWYLSPPIGGRMIRSDPVFTADEKLMPLNIYHNDPKLT